MRRKTGTKLEIHLPMSHRNVILEAMSNKKRRKLAKTQRPSQQRRPNSPLSTHKQQGKTLKPPFNTIGNIKLSPWLRDRFPDHLWTCYILGIDLDRGSKLAVATLDCVGATLDELLNNQAGDRPVLDGSLTSWEDIPSRFGKDAGDATGRWALWPSVSRGIRTYARNVPRSASTWLIAGLRKQGLAIDPQVAEATLNVYD